MTSSIKSYFASRQSKLTNQFLALRPEGEDVSKIFQGVMVAVDGYTPELSALEIKQIMSQHGGLYATNVWAVGITHLICSHLPTAKIKKELARKRPLPMAYITAKWIVDSLSAGRQVPVGPYVISQLVNPKQSTLASWCAASSSSSSLLGAAAGGEEEEEEEEEHTIFRLVEDPIVLDACWRLKIDLETSLVVVVADASSSSPSNPSSNNKAIIQAVLFQTRQYLPADQLHAGMECRIQPGFAKLVAMEKRDGKRTCAKFATLMHALCRRDHSNHTSRAVLLSSRECVVITTGAALSVAELASMRAEVEAACGCKVETKTMPDWKQYKTAAAASSASYDAAAWRATTAAAARTTTTPHHVGETVSVEVLHRADRPLAQALHTRLAKRRRRRGDEEEEAWEMAWIEHSGDHTPKSSPSIPVDAPVFHGVASLVLADIESLVRPVLPVLQDGDWVRLKLVSSSSHQEEDVRGGGDHSRSSSAAAAAFPQSFDEVDMSVFYELPPDLRNSIQEELSSRHHRAEFECDDEEEEEEEDTRQSFPQTYSQIDPSVLRELPEDLARQVELEFKLRNVTVQTHPHQAFAEIRAHFREWFAAVVRASCPLANNNFAQSCKRYVGECLLPSRELSSLRSWLRLVERLGASTTCTAPHHQDSSCCWKQACDDVRADALHQFGEMFEGAELDL